MFAKRAAKHICGDYQILPVTGEIPVDPSRYEGYEESYKQMVLEAIEKEKNSHE